MSYLVDTNILLQWSQPDYSICMEGRLPSVLYCWEKLRALENDDRGRTVWTKDKQQRLDELRIRESEGTLTDADGAEMEALFAELDTQEAEAMRPALERMEKRQAELQRQKEKMAAEAAQLERVVQDHEQLLADARSYLDDLLAPEKYWPPSSSSCTSC